MNLEELNYMYIELEKLATYNNEEIDDNRFNKFISKLKNDLVKKNYIIPDLIKNSKSKIDFRNLMQEEGRICRKKKKTKIRFISNN